MEGPSLAAGSWLVVPARVLWNGGWKSQFSLLNLSLERPHHSPQPLSYSFVAVELPAPWEGRKCRLKKGWKHKGGNIGQELNFHHLNPSLLALVLTRGSLQACALFSWADHFQLAASMALSWGLPLLCGFCTRAWSWTDLPWEVLVCLLDLDKVQRGCPSVFGEAVGSVLVVMGFWKMERADKHQ